MLELNRRTRSSLARMIRRTSDRYMAGFVYILKFRDSGKYYIGSTNNLERRLFEHNSKQSKYTRENGKFDLVFKQEFVAIQEARRVEYKLKKFKSRKIIEQILSEGIIKMHS